MQSLNFLDFFSSDFFKVEISNASSKMLLPIFMHTSIKNLTEKQDTL